MLGLVITACGGGNQLPVPGLPAELPEPHTPEWADEFRLGRDWANTPLGVGHLGPVIDAMPWLAHSWLENILLPLYQGPAGPHWGWLARGWLISIDGSKRPYPASCLIETQYETSSIILSELTDDGWFRIVIDKPCDGERESLWSHRTLLGLGEKELILQSWHELLLSFEGHGASLLFRQKEIPHALRAGPGTDNSRITWIGATHSIEPLEVVGDWMRIRVFQPSDYCVLEEDWRGLVHEGWVRWRDPVKGPWLFYPTRGC